MQRLARLPILKAIRCQSAAELSTTLRTLSQSDLSQALRDRIQGYVNLDKVVVFMKGTPEQPMCGFSRNCVKVLEFHNVPFKGYNVLEDEELRDGVKKFSDWPTIPQVYVKGTFLGGSDILIQMHKEGEITEYLDQQSIPSKFSDKK
jgi:monothiol glutaredoxin